MMVRLDHPCRFPNHCATHAGDFLLLKSPLGELDLVREKIAVHVDMYQLELGSQGVQGRACLWIRSISIHNLNPPFVVGIASKVLVTIPADFKVVLVLCHRRLLVMGVQALESRRVQEANIVAMLDILQFIGDRAIAFLKDPIIVGILVWVQRDLLL